MMALAFSIELSLLAMGKAGWKRSREFFFMSSKLYVGNLNYRTTEEKLKDLFSQFGEVTSVNILQVGVLVSLKCQPKKWPKKQRTS